MRKILALVFGALVSFNSVADMEVPQHEKDALLDLYNATGGYEKWRDWQSDLLDPVDYGWNESDSLSDVCNWYNVTCVCSIERTCSDSNGKTNIYILDIPEGAEGELPSSIGDLRELRNVYITETKITGTLPASVGNWTKLERLVLQYGNFSGRLPDEILNWVNLHEVRLHANALYTENPEIEELLTLADYTNQNILASNGFYGDVLIPFKGTQANDMKVLSQTGKVTQDRENDSVSVDFKLSRLGGGYPIAFVSEDINGPYQQIMMGNPEGIVGYTSGYENEVWRVSGLKVNTNYFISVRSQYMQGIGVMSNGDRANTLSFHTALGEARETSSTSGAASNEKSSGGGGANGPLFLLILTIASILKNSARKVKA